MAGPKTLPLSSSSALLPFAYEEYRHNDVIAKTIELLNALDIPEVLIDLPSVEESLRNILTDPRLEDCSAVFDQTKLSYNPDSVDDYFHKIERYFRGFEKPD